MDIACGHCGALEDDATLVCRSCGGFVHERAMDELQLLGRGLESQGRKAEAAAAWARILPLLPADARQRAGVEGEVRRLSEGAAPGEIALPPAIGPGTSAAAQQQAARKRGILGTVATMGLLLFSKLKFLLLGLTKWKTVLSMAVMAFFYTRFYGWTFAVGIVLLIYVHEMGHMIAIRQRGLASSWPIFIPFVGAFVRLNSNPRNAAEDAYIGYAGPLFGSIAALGVWFGGVAIGSPQILALAFFGFYLNFFNLIAIVPLDGGRVTNALDRSTWLAILPPMWLAAWWNPETMVIVVTAVATFRGLGVILGNRVASSFQAVSPRSRWIAAVAYGGLAVALIAGMKLTRPHDDPAMHHRGVTPISMPPPPGDSSL